MRTIKTLGKRTIVLSAAVAAVGFVGANAFATDYTWNGGGGDDNWGTGANWGGTAPTPGSGNDLYFAGSTRLTPNNNYTAGDDFRSIYFSSGASSFTISGNVIDLFWKIENNSSNLQTWNCDISAQGTALELNPVSGDLTIGSANIYNNGKDVIAYGGNQGTGLGKTLTLSGNLQGNGKLIVRNDAKVKITGASAYYGNTEIDRGDFIIGSGGSVANTARIYVGHGANQSDTARLYLEASGLTLARPITVNPGADSSKRVIGGLNTSGTVTYSGGITLDDDVTFDTASGGSVALITTALTDGAGSGRTITKTGAGTLDFTATGNLASTLDSPKWQLNQGTIKLDALNRLGNNPGAVQADFLTLNGGMLQTTAATGNWGNRGLTIGASGGTIDVGNVANYDALTFNTANTFLGSGKVILQNGNSANNSRGLQFTAAQTSFNGTIQIGNGATSRAAYMYFSGGGNYTFSGNFEFNDTLASGANILSERSGNSVVTLGGNITFTGTSFEQPNVIVSRFKGGRLDIGSTSTVSAATGVTGWLGIRNSSNGEGDDVNQININGTIANGSGNMNVAYVDDGSNYTSYKVTGNNSYTGGGTVGGSPPTGRYGNVLGTQIQQGTVFWGHANALGANNASNAISIFRSTGSRPSVYAGLLADVAADSILGNQQTITVRSLNAVAVNLFTIGGNQAFSTTYNNPIVFNNPGGGSGSGGAGVALLLSQATGGKTTFSSSITATGWNVAQVGAPVFEKAGAGTVVLQSAASSYKATPVVRNGTLLLEAGTLATGDTGVLGDPTVTDFGVANAIQLGGARTSSGLSGGNVTLATVGNIGGTYSATGGANGIGQLTGVSNGSANLDNTTLTVGNRVLVLFSGDSGTNGQAPVAGVYVVTSTTGSVTLDRVNESIGNGSWVTANTVPGKINSGKTFYVANQNTTFNNGGASGTVQVWLEDEGNNLSATLNPSLLTNAAVTIARDIRVNASPAIQTSTLGGNSDHNSTFSGGVTLNRDLRLTSVATGTNKTTVSGVINDGAGSFAVEKIGTGRLELTNANTYDGGTTVTAGTLLVNNTSGSGTGTGTVIVNGGTLGGTGTISGAVTVNSGGKLAPGNSIGTLTLNSDLTLAGGYDVELDGTSVTADKTVLTAGNVTLTGASLIVTKTGTLAASQSYTIVDLQSGSATRTGVFSGLAEAATVLTADGYDLKITYAGGSGNDIVLYTSAVPEPASLSLLALGAVGLLRRRRV